MRYSPLVQKEVNVETPEKGSTRDELLVLMMTAQL